MSFWDLFRSGSGRPPRPSPPSPPPAQDWRLVKTLSVALTQQTTQAEGKMYYHLFECQYGKRKVEFACTFPEIAASDRALKLVGERLDDYQEKIFPWLNGRYVAGIPSYQEVDLQDVQAKLSS